jgi:hypothetical protein
MQRTKAARRSFSEGGPVDLRSFGWQAIWASSLNGNGDSYATEHFSSLAWCAFSRRNRRSFSNTQTDGRHKRQKRLLCRNAATSIHSRKIY